MSPDLYPQILLNHVPQTPTTFSLSLVYYLQLLSFHPTTNKVSTLKTLRVIMQNPTLCIASVNRDTLIEQSTITSKLPY